MTSSVSVKGLSCRCCGGFVAAGEEIFPEHDKNKDGFLWAHYACAKQAALSLGHSGDSHTSSKGPM